MSNEPVPFLDLETIHRELEEELVQIFRSALRSARFVGGPEVEAFEQEFAAYCGTNYCLGVSSGTDALRFALMASGIRSGDAVVTVSHTFIATVEAISQAGAETEFVDIDERTYNMSAAALSSYLEGCRRDQTTGLPLGRRTGKPLKAVVPVHLYGQCADMTPITEVARRYGLMVIEDACQAHGAEYQVGRDTASESGALLSGRGPDGGWRRAGSMGKAAAFSFYPGKNLGACGEAGAVTTDDAQVARTVKMLRDHGQVEKYYHDLEGYNGRLDAIQAGFLRIKLQHLDAWNTRRRAAARRYDELLRASGVTPPAEYEWSRAAYHLYVVRTSERAELIEHLKASGIATGLHYPVPVHLQNCYAAWGYREGSLPVTEQVAREVLSLPMFPDVTAEQQQRVADQIAQFLHVGSVR